MATKTIFIASALITGGITAYANQNSNKNNNVPPNIIFILADDMGIGDLGCYGQDQIQTPNIDLLANKGARFTTHYAGSTVSAPSRCALMTGKHTGHGHVRGNKGIKTETGFFDLNIPASEVTVAELAKQRGYSTLCVGKWGLGAPNSEGSPINQGFDYFFGYLSQGAAHRYYPKYLYENDQKVMLNGKVYSHYMIMEKGLQFIKENTDKPIFAYFALTPPHADLDHPDLSQYDGKFEETPYINKRGKGYMTQQKPRATYAALVSEIDRSVGQIVALLESQGRLDNSIIIFSSDNGVHGVGGHAPEFFNSNGNFRGTKRDLYEGGIRTPFVVRWDSKIKAGTTIDHVSTFWDFLPTVCDIVGIETPDNCDGISYLPTLLGENAKQKKHDYLYYEFFEQHGKQCVIQNGWKLVRLNVSKPTKTIEELYNMNNDPQETNNIIDSHKAKAKNLRKIMDNERTHSEHFNFTATSQRN